MTGQLPADLNGRYLRNGPNPITPPDPATYHWFTGEGMVHGMRLRDGKAEWYRNRWVRNREVAAALGEPDRAGAVHAEMDVAANTNVIGHAGRLLAIVEAGGRPIELSGDLDTIARTDFEGTLPNGFTAHPKRDPSTGELHVTAYFWGLPYVHYIVVGTDGRARVVEPIEVKGSPMVHDMSITETRAVFYDLPVTFNMDMAMAGARLPYRWDDDYGARIGVMPFGATSNDVRWVDIEPCYVFHPLNAYDDGDNVVLDVMRWPRMFDRNLLGPNDGEPSLWRWTDPAAGQGTRSTFDDRPRSFPGSTSGSWAGAIATAGARGRAQVTTASTSTATVSSSTTSCRATRRRTSSGPVRAQARPCSFPALPMRPRTTAM